MIFNAIAITTFFAFNFFFLSIHRLRHIWYEKKNKKIKINSNSNFIVTQLIVNHQIENCKLYEIKFSILKTTNNWIIKLCFFLNHSRRWFSDFYRKLTRNREKRFRVRKSRSQCFFKFQNFKCENRDYNDFLNYKKHIYSKFATSTIILIKWYCYFKKLRCLKKTRVKNSKFKTMRVDFRLSKIQIKQIRNIKSIISWNQQFRHINRINATTISASIFAHMRQLICTLHLAKRVYNKFFKR